MDEDLLELLYPHSYKEIGNEIDNTIRVREEYSYSFREENY